MELINTNLIFSEFSSSGGEVDDPKNQNEPTYKCSKCERVYSSQVEANNCDCKKEEDKK